MLIEYSSNNSGGGWWLKDDDWLALEKAGWKLVRANEEFIYKDGNYVLGEDGLPMLKVSEKSTFADKDDRGNWRYLGAISKYAFKKFDSVKDALQEFEKVTGQDVMDEGCNCCGAPHCFSWDGGSCSGEDCGAYLYGERAKKTKRELLES